MKIPDLVGPVDKTSRSSKTCPGSDWSPGERRRSVPFPPVAVLPRHPRSPQPLSGRTKYSVRPYPSEPFHPYVLSGSLYSRVSIRSLHLSTLARGVERAWSVSVGLAPSRFVGRVYLLPGYRRVLARSEDEVGRAWGTRCSSKVGTD